MDNQNVLNKYIQILKKKLEPGKRGKMTSDLDKMNEIAKSIPCSDGFEFDGVVFDASRMDMVCVHIKHANGCYELYDLQDLRLI
ncbi:hypothetical protein KAR91_22985 [Candidatus Pacearchaeota archaeon]|nr:hypothetical protein [Candidatus Pacearchaeota archaeon]